MNRISPALKHKTKYSDKTFKNKKKLYQKIKYNNVKPTIKNLSSVCYKNSQKTHKTVNLRDKKPQTR